MCGICGIYSEKTMSKSTAMAFEKLMLNTESRGRHSFGFFTYPNREIFKQKMSVTEYIKNEGESKEVCNKNGDKKTKENHFWNKIEFNNIAFGHCRLATQGTFQNNENNHPFQTQDFVLAHNGVIGNDDSLKRKYKLNYASECDSFIIIALIQKFYNENGGDTIQAIRSTTKEIFGSYACWLFNKRTEKVFLFRHHNPIILGYIPSMNSFAFASEHSHLSFLSGLGKEREYLNGELKTKMFFERVKEDTIYALSFDRIKKFKFDPCTVVVRDNVVYNVGRSIKSKWDTFQRKSRTDVKNMYDDDPYESQLREEIKNNSGYTNARVSGVDEDELAMLDLFDVKFSVYSGGRKLKVWAIAEELKTPLRSYGYCVKKNNTLKVKVKKLSHLIECLGNACESAGIFNPLGDNYSSQTKDKKEENSETTMIVEEMVKDIDQVDNEESFDVIGLRKLFN